MTYQEIQKKLEKCELAINSIKDGTYSSKAFNKTQALEKFNLIKESLEKKLNLLNEEETMFVSTKGGETKAVSMDRKAAMDLKKDPNITGIDTAKGQKLKEDEYDAEEDTISTSHITLVAKEVHKALIDALQETGHEVSEDKISSINPQTFTVSVRFKDNTQSDYSFEVSNLEVKLDGNIIVATNKKGVSPVLNKAIAKDNLVKYLKTLTEDTEFEVDAKGKITGNLIQKLSDKDKETLKKIEDMLAKEKKKAKIKNEAQAMGFGTGQGRSKTISKGRESRPDLAQARKDAVKPAKKYVMKNGIPHKYDEDGNLVPLKRMNDDVEETKGAPKGHYFTKSGNLVKGRLTKSKRDRGARLSDPLDKQRSKVPPVTQYNEDLDSDLPKGKLSVAKLQKLHDMIVDKMKKINKIRIDKGNDHMYQGGSEPGKHSVMDHLKSLTAKKKKVQAALDKAVADVGKGQQLDTNVDEASPFVLAADAARDAGKKEFEYPEGSGKMHPVTIKQDIEVEEEINEGTDLYEGDSFSMKRFAGPNGIALQITARKLKGGGYEYIQIDGDKVNEFTRAMVHVGQEFTNLDRQLPVNDGKYKSDAQRKAIYATKAEKGELKEEMDGGRLFDYFNNKGYDITERSSDGRVPGFEGYMVSKGESRSPQAVIFQHNKDTDEFTISRMSGYRIDQEEAMKAGMREKSSNAVAGIDGYMTDGNYSPTPISVEGLKDIVDHVMTGLDREAEAQRDFYARRGPVSGTIDENQEAIRFAQFVHAHKLRDGQIKDDEYLKDIYDNFKQNYEDDNPDNFFMDIDEKAPGFKHDCAAKVVHETYGVGICIPEKHTLIKEGNKYVVTHYDVLFKEGKKVVEDIPVEDLKIVTQKEHWHKNYKKKKK